MAFNFGTPSAGATGVVKPTLGFGSSTGTTGFGATTTATAPFGFGTTTTTSAPSFGGFGGFGTTTSSAAAPAFGTTTTSTGGFGGFGASTAVVKPTFGASTSTFGTQATGAFGTSGTSTGTFGFGGTSTLGGGTGTGLFGGTGTGSLLSGAPAFGATTGAAPAAGFLGQQPQQQPVQNVLTNIATAMSMPMVYGDERDAILARWNQLQAFWGIGKGYFSQNGAVDFTPENPFCRLKAVGYSKMPIAKNEDGLVALIIKKKYAEVSQNQQAVVDNLSRIFGSKPNLSICVNGLKPVPEDMSEIVIYVTERQQTGTARTFPASELFTFLTSQNTKQQLEQQLAVVDVINKTGLSPEHLAMYLENAPSGIDPIVWEQAKLDNPDPSSLLPVPMIGFSELKQRLQHQDQTTKLHQQKLDMLSQDIAELQRKHTNTVAKTEQCKRKHLELSHRILKVMVKQEIYRKLGYGAQVEEEQLRVVLESLQAELNAPTQFKGRLNELMSQIRMQNQIMTSSPETNYQIDASFQHEIKQHLKMQQDGLQHLINIIKDDLDDLSVIELGLTEVGPKR